MPSAGFNNLKKRAGPGRPKGMPNKVTKELKDMILTALDESGGVEYLKKRAEDNPAAFLTLIGKVLPLQIGNVPGQRFEVGTAWQNSAAFRKA